MLIIPYLNIILIFFTYTKTAFNGNVLSSLIIKTNLIVFSVSHIPREYPLQLVQRKPCITSCYSRKPKRPRILLIITVSQFLMSDLRMTIQSFLILAGKDRSRATTIKLKRTRLLSCNEVYYLLIYKMDRGVSILRHQSRHDHTNLSDTTPISPVLPRFLRYGEVYDPSIAKLQ